MIDSQAGIEAEKNALETKVIWGDLQPENHRNVQVAWTFRQKSPIDKDYIFGITVEVAGQAASIKARKIVPEAEIVGATEKLPGFVRNTLITLARQVSPRLYETDPRKGLSVDLGKDFPQCPLFDRPDYDPRDIAMRFKKNKMWEPFRCPFCTTLMSGTAIWCGGNVSWAHPDCAPWIQGPPVWFRNA